jgi:hypothetical protein
MSRKGRCSQAITFQKQPALETDAATRANCLVPSNLERRATQIRLWKLGAR